MLILRNFFIIFNLEAHIIFEVEVTRLRLQELGTLL